MTVVFTKVGNVRPGGLEDTQAEQSEHRDQREVADVR